MSENGDKFCYRFDEFELDTRRRVVKRSGVPVILKPKAVDVLIALVESRGRPISKTDLLDKVWNDRYVEEKNLSVQVAALRKALGEGKGDNRFIATVPGTGYAFVANVMAETANGSEASTEAYRRIVIEEEYAETTDIPELAAAKTAIDQSRMAVGVAASGRGIAGAKRSRLSTASVTLILTVLAGVGGFTIWRFRSSLMTAPQTLAAPGAKIRQLTTNGRVLLASISPDGKLFAYTTREGAESALWVGFVAGGKATLLAEASESQYYNLAFTPDSSAVLYGVTNEATGQNGLYRMPASGGPPQEIIHGVVRFFVSTLGPFIYYLQPDKEHDSDRLMEFEQTSGATHEIANLPHTLEAYAGSISVSPSRRQIAIDLPTPNRPFYYDLALMDAKSGEVRRVNTELFRNPSRTVWSEDGRKIYITATPKESWSSYIYHQVYTVDAETLEAEPVTDDISSYEGYLSVTADGHSVLSVEHRQTNNVVVAPANDLAASKMITHGSFGRYDGLWGMDFTPDGQIVYTNSDMSSQVISIMNADGSNVRQLTPPGRVDSACSVTADGRYIVFLSNRSGLIETWRMNIDGTGAVPLTNIGYAFQPFLSADGNWVYFRNGSKEGGGRLQRVSINGGEIETVTDTDAGWGCSSPDGRYIAAGQNTDKSRLAIIDTASMKIVDRFEFAKQGAISLGCRWTPDSRSIIYRDWVDGYWSQDRTGGDPMRLPGLPHEKLYNFVYSKDGAQFAYVRGQEMRDAVLVTSSK